MGYPSSSGRIQPYPIYVLPVGYRVRSFDRMFERDLLAYQEGTLGILHEILVGMVQAMDYNTDAFTISDWALDEFYVPVAQRLTRHGAFVSVNYFASLGQTLCLREFTAIPLGG